MSEKEYLEFIRLFPYDAMGDYSTFREHAKENNFQNTKELSKSK